MTKQPRRADATVTRYMKSGFKRHFKSKRSDTFRIQLLHDREKQEYILDRDNDWTATFCRQPNDTYEIRELGDRGTRYQINEECPKNSGYFEIRDGAVNITVLNASEAMAKLHLETVVKNCEDDLTVPSKNIVFHIQVKGKHMDRTFVLNERNHWHQAVELPQTEYQVIQKEDPQFKELYHLVDDARECDGTIVLCSDMHVQFVNVMKCTLGSIISSRYIRDTSCGCLKKPQQGEEFKVGVGGETFHQIITLNSCNRWRETLGHLPMRVYELRELNAAYDVSYIINGGKGAESAVINVEAENVDIKVINEEKQPHEGSIELCGLIRDTERCYRYPSEQDSLWVRIKGEEETGRVLLNYASHFYASLRNLKDG